MSKDRYETGHDDVAVENLADIRLTLLYNKTDMTYGIAGANMFDIFFLRPKSSLEYSDHSEGRTYSLSATMTPKVVVGLKTMYRLNLPYTACDSSQSSKLHIAV